MALEQLAGTQKAACRAWLDGPWQAAPPTPRGRPGDCVPPRNRPSLAETAAGRRRGSARSEQEEAPPPTSQLGARQVWPAEGGEGGAVTWGRGLGRGARRSGSQDDGTGRGLRTRAGPRRRGAGGRGWRRRTAPDLAGAMSSARPQFSIDDAFELSLEDAGPGPESSGVARFGPLHFERRARFEVADEDKQSRPRYQVTGLVRPSSPPARFRAGPHARPWRTSTQGRICL